MTKIIYQPELFAEAIGDADGTFDAFTDSVPMGQKNDGNQACIC